MRSVESNSWAIARALVALAAVLGAALGAGPASAAFAGRNGELVLAAACAHPTPGCHGLEVVRPDGSGRRRLCPQVPECASASAPVWSPDGQRVAFGSPVFGTTAVVYADGTCFQCQGASAPSSGFGTVQRPAWTPDGQHLLEDADPGVDRFGDDGLLEQQVIPALGYASVDDLAVSARGILAFARVTGKRRRDLYLQVLGVNGERPRRLTYAGGDQPAWSPSGRQLAFVRARDIYLISAAGRGLQLLVRDGVDPAFSPDGRFVAFARPRHDRPGRVLIISTLGGPARTVPGVTANEIDWQPVVDHGMRGCSFDPGARIVEHSGGTLVATRTSTPAYESAAQVWDACTTARSRPRVLWIAQGDGDFTPLDGLSSFQVVDPWVAFVVYSSNGDHEGPPAGTTSIEAFDTQTGLRPESPASFQYCDCGTIHSGAVIHQLAVDSSGDVAWIATVTPLFTSTTTPVPQDQVGLYDAHGTHILDQGNPGDMSLLELNGTTITWLDRGQPRSATITPR